MAFTQVTLTCQYEFDDATPAVGTVSLRPDDPMTNGSVVVEAARTRTLDAEGVLTMAIYANTDPDTVPPLSTYRVDERIGGERRVYHVRIPHDAGDTVNLADLQPLAEPSTLAPPAVVNTDGDAGRTIFVGSAAPTSPSVGDVWISPA
jgi:hypothetical protein